MEGRSSSQLPIDISSNSTQFQLPRSSRGWAYGATMDTDGVCVSHPSPWSPPVQQGGGVHFHCQTVQLRNEVLQLLTFTSMTPPAHTHTHHELTTHMHTS